MLLFVVDVIEITVQVFLYEKLNVAFPIETNSVDRSSDAVAKLPFYINITTYVYIYYIYIYVPHIYIALPKTCSIAKHSSKQQQLLFPNGEEKKLHRQRDNLKIYKADTILYKITRKGRRSQLKDERYSKIEKGGGGGRRSRRERERRYNK